MYFNWSCLIVPLLYICVLLHTLSDVINIKYLLFILYLSELLIIKYRYRILQIAVPITCLNFHLQHQKSLTVPAAPTFFFLTEFKSVLHYLSCHFLHTVSKNPFFLLTWTTHCLNPMGFLLRRTLQSESKSSFEISHDSNSICLVDIFFFKLLTLRFFSVGTRPL